MAEALMELQGVTKKFGSDIVLNNISFSLYPGEIHAIIGENSAGKSMLGKVLTGITPIDSGNIFFENKPVTLSSPALAVKLGIASIQQEVQLFDCFTVGENICAGNLPVKKRLFSDIAALSQKPNQSVFPNSCKLVLSQLISIPRTAFLLGWY